MSVHDLRMPLHDLRNRELECTPRTIPVQCDQAASMVNLWVCGWEGHPLIQVRFCDRVSQIGGDAIECRQFLKNLTDSQLDAKHLLDADDRLTQDQRICADFNE